MPIKLIQAPYDYTSEYIYKNKQCSSYRDSEQAISDERFSIVMGGGVIIKGDGSDHMSFT